MKRRIIALCGATALLPGLMLASMSAPAQGAAPSPTPSGPAATASSNLSSPSDADSAIDPVTGLPVAQLKALKRDLHLTTAEVAKRLKVDAKATKVEKSLKKKLGKAYAGTWVSAKGTSVVVGVTTKKAAAKVRKAGATPRIVARSLTTLSATKASLDATARKSTKTPRAIQSWYVDPATNQVVVSATNKKAAQTFINRAGLSSKSVATVVTAVVIKPLADIRGGDEFQQRTSLGGGAVGITMCSIGFAVQGGFVTAGHCGTTGQNVTDVNGNAMGTFQGSTFPNADYAWVQTNSNWSPTPKVNQYNGSTVDVAGSAEAAIGASICRSGRTTGWRCGTVQAKNVTVNYSNGPVPGLTRTSACANGGDSGGSFIAGDQAQGVTSGGGGNCGDSNATTVFQPLKPILDRYGLTLITTGGSGPVSAIQGYSNRCIDVPNSDFSDSKQLQIYDCNGSGAQRWTFATDGTLRAGGKCMDVRSSGTGNGTVVQLYTCNGTAAQQFRLNTSNDLVSVLANKCVDVKDWNGNNGGQLQLWECGGTANQKWWKH